MKYSVVIYLQVFYKFLLLYFCLILIRVYCWSKLSVIPTPSDYLSLCGCSNILWVLIWEVKCERNRSRDQLLFFLSYRCSQLWATNTQTISRLSLVVMFTLFSLISCQMLENRGSSSPDSFPEMFHGFTGRFLVLSLLVPQLSTPSISAEFIPLSFRSACARFSQWKLVSHVFHRVRISYANLILFKWSAWLALSWKLNPSCPLSCMLRPFAGLPFLPLNRRIFRCEIYLYR